MPRGPAIRKTLSAWFFRLQCLLLVPIFRVLLRLEVTGPRIRRRPGEGLIVAPNHQSWLDPALAQVGVMPHRLTFLMTEIYFDLPIVGLYFRASGARPVREDGPSVAGLRATRKALEEGEVVCIFPEGELKQTDEIGPFQRGVARLARRTGVPVLPVGISGAFGVFSKAQRTPRIRPVRIRLGEPMRYTETDDREGEQRFTDKLLDAVRSLME